MKSKKINIFLVPTTIFDDKNEVPLIKQKINSRILYLDIKPLELTERQRKAMFYNRLEKNNL